MQQVQQRRWRPQRHLEAAHLVRILIALGLGAVVTAAAQAQNAGAAPSVGQAAPNTGQIQGQVVVETGDPIPGVRVVVKGTPRSAMTDAHGIFRITEVPVGQVVIVAQSVGRETAELTVLVDPGAATQADLVLGPVQ